MDILSQHGIGLSGSLFETNYGVTVVTTDVSYENICTRCADYNSIYKGYYYVAYQGSLYKFDSYYTLITSIAIDSYNVSTNYPNKIIFLNDQIWLHTSNNTLIIYNLNLEKITLTLTKSLGIVGDGIYNGGSSYLPFVYSNYYNNCYYNFNGNYIAKLDSIATLTNVTYGTLLKLSMCILGDYMYYSETKDASNIYLKKFDLKTNIIVLTLTIASTDTTHLIGAVGDYIFLNSSLYKASDLSLYSNISNLLRHSSKVFYYQIPSKKYMYVISAPNTAENLSYRIYKINKNGQLDLISTNGFSSYANVIYPRLFKQSSVISEFRHTNSASLNTGNYNLTTYQKVTVSKI